MLNPDFTIFPTLTTQRLVLRRFTDADAADLFKMRGNADVMEYIARPLCKTEGDALALIKVIDDLLAVNSGITWCIYLKDDPKFIGSIGFWRIEKHNHRAEIGYLLNPAYQGHGIVQEAVQMVIDFGFNQLKLHSIQANVSPQNKASIKLLEGNNFVREGHFRGDHYHNGRFEDTLIYALLTKT